MGTNSLRSNSCLNKFVIFVILSFNKKNFDKLEIAISNLNASYNFGSFRALKISAHLIKEQINAFRL